ncbi:hypothetical protein pEaSNUABM9_00269 [Erwinia phage pEa_SNUABM_9]|nr:hypothetical protein pEaSNUABM9_00269 [Erwinia phage pEa_SNUABM_9]
MVRADGCAPISIPPFGVGVLYIFLDRFYLGENTIYSFTLDYQGALLWKTKSKYLTAMKT